MDSLLDILIDVHNGGVVRIQVHAGRQEQYGDKQYDKYRIEIDVSLELFGQLEELEKVVEMMIPCNMVIVIKNKLSYEMKDTVYIAGGISFMETFCIAGDSIEYVNLQAKNFIGAGTAITECVIVSSEE